MKKYVAITGASSGIGQATAKQFARRKKNLILIARRTERLIALKDELNHNYPALDIIVCSFDLTDVSKLESLFYSLNDYYIDTWINNAGVGLYTSVTQQDIDPTIQLIRLNVEALSILSLLYVKKYYAEKGTQLINISSAGGYIMVPTAVTYCASKYYVSSFTEALALELRESGSELQVKVLAPAVTKTEFGQIANIVSEYRYDLAFGHYHSSLEISEFLMRLYDSDKMVGIVNRETLAMKLTDNLFSYAKYSTHNQKM